VKVVTKDDDWAWRFDNLPKFDAGKEIRYEIREDLVEDYVSEISGFDVTNTYEPVPPTETTVPPTETTVSPTETTAPPAETTVPPTETTPGSPPKTGEGRSIGPLIGVILLAAAGLIFIVLRARKVRESRD